jgi:hypothetical protein
LLKIWRSFHDKTRTSATKKKTYTLSKSGKILVRRPLHNKGFIMDTISISIIFNNMFLRNKKIVATIYSFNTDRKVAVKNFILWDLK